MGNIVMNQAEIDRLLNTIARQEEDDSEEEEGSLIDLTKARVYRRFPKRLSITQGVYRSPLIQSEQIVFNPEPGKPVAADKVVVRSLFKYSSAKGMA